jgi:hypothetical protein
MIIALALLQVEVVFLLILVVVFIIAGLLFVGVFIRALRRNPNRPGGRGGQEGLRPAYQERSVVGSYLDKDEIRKMLLESPAYRDQPLTDEELEAFVDNLYVNQRQLLKEYLSAELRQELMRMQNRGEVEYDPETDSYRRLK